MSEVEIDGEQSHVQGETGPVPEVVSRKGDELVDAGMGRVPDEDTRVLPSGTPRPSM